MDTITLTYGAVGSEQHEHFDVLSLRGVDGDEIERHLGFQNVAADGTIYENIDSFRRIITVDFGVVTEDSKRVFLSAFAKSFGTKVLTYGSEDIPVVVEEPSRFSNVWNDNIQYAKHYTMRLKEKSSQTSIIW